MYQKTKEPVCIKCKGQGVVEVFEPEVGFGDSLRSLLAGVGGH